MSLLSTRIEEAKKNYPEQSAQTRLSCEFLRGNLSGRPLLGFIPLGSIWQKAIIRYSFINDTPDLTQANQRTILQAAFSQWAGVVPLTFQELPATSDSDIKISFASGAHGTVASDNAFDGPGGVLAHAFAPNAGLGGDVHFDEAETWTNGPVIGGFDLLGVGLHEIGHALGLDHNNIPGSTMYPYYPFATPPAAGDVAGMRSIYRSHIWLASLYRDVIGRRFDDSGLDFWVRRYYSGNNAEDLAHDFCLSLENSGSLARKLYIDLLDREGDPEGLSLWTDKLLGKTNYFTIMTEFLSSPEYLLKYPLPDAFVVSLYNKVLGREPDAGGLATHIGSIGNGFTPLGVAQSFVGSGEFREKTVGELYRRYLRRDADAGGMLTWTTELLNGRTYQDLIAALVSSTEYQNGSVGWWLG